MPKPARYKRALPSLVMLALGLLLSSPLFAAVEVTAIEMTVSDLPRAAAFYSEVLQFRVAAEEQNPEQRSIRLQLGEEALILRQSSSPNDAVPSDLAANDISFQHIAIVVSDIDAAYAHLLRRQVRIVSAGVQHLPDWNFAAADIRALYFRDPDGHFLELIQFPHNKGEPRWLRRSDGLFRGIDHTAIVVSDLERSVAFYRDVLGFTIIGNSFNYGGEQEWLSRVPGARVRIASLRGAKGPGIELLHYEAPKTSNAELKATDFAWRTVLSRNRSESARETADPDGHALLIERLVCCNSAGFTVVHLF